MSGTGTGTRHILFPFLARQWRALLVAGLATVIVAAAEVLRPFPLKFVIDHLFAGGIDASVGLGPEEILLLAGIAVFVLAVALLEAAGSYLMDVRLMLAGERIVHDLRIAIYEHLQRLSLGFHQRRHTGDLVTRVTGDVNAVGTFFASSLATMVSSLLTLIGMVVVGFLVDPVLALLAFATAPLIGLVAFRFRRRIGTLQRRQRQMEGEIASLATESLSSIQQVKALGSESFEHGRLEQKSEERRDAGYETSMVEGSFSRLIDIVGAIGTAVVIVVGVVRASAGIVSPGDLVVMVTYVRRVYRPLRAMAREWIRFQRTIARAERVAELLASDDMLVDRPTTAVPGRLRGSVQFDGVSFSYEADRPALTDVSLAVPAGERVAIVGRSGAGKSTLAALAARFYDPSAGRVLIDGIDVRDYPLAWLRGQVGLVLQDAVLFTGSVADNIGWGLDASREEVVRAARLVGAEAFIEQLPEGYDTPLDPAGAGLSGGQRQRIAIARTLLRDPQILLLDEPTTGLDVESEAKVLAGLDVLMRGRTTIIISHSLALAQRADRVIVLDAGRVVQAGPPSDVLGRDGPFRDLVAEQPAASEPERPPRAPSSPPIADPRLPQAGLLLDTNAVAPMLERSFDKGTRLDVGIRYLRYKPGTNLMVHYDIAVNGHRYDAVGMITAGESLGHRAQAPESVALAQRVGTRVEASSPLAYDRELGTLFQWYPLDLALPTLAWPPSELRRQMSALGVPVPPSDEEPDRLAYKPRRRAVLRVDGHVVKLYRRQAEFERALAGQQAASRLDAVVAPRLEAAMHEHLVTVQSLLEGVSADAVNEAAAAGELLARLHRSDSASLPVFEPRSQLAAAAASARLVWTIAPEMRPRLERLLAALAAGMPDIPELVPSHGDFNARQLLVMGDGSLGLTDFDEFCLAPAALDPATYAAYFVLGRPGDLAAARAALDELCRGHGGRPRHLDWYFATMILRRSPRPFRYFEPEWPQRVEAMVGAAEEVAAGGEIAALREAAGG